jgi:hypothetical protein
MPDVTPGTKMCFCRELDFLLAQLREAPNIREDVNTKQEQKDEIDLRIRDASMRIVIFSPAGLVEKMADFIRETQAGRKDSRLYALSPAKSPSFYGPSLQFGRRGAGAHGSRDSDYGVKPACGVLGRS